MAHSTVRSNALSEATNTHIRLLTRRAYGYHSPEALIAMATLTRAPGAVHCSQGGHEDRARADSGHVLILRSAAPVSTPHRTLAGQVSGIGRTRAARPRCEVARCAIPSTSPRATPRHPEGSPGGGSRRYRRMLPSGCRAVGLRQVDGTPHEPQRARSKTDVGPELTGRS